MAKFGFHLSVGGGPHVWFDGDNYGSPYTHLNAGSTITKEEEFAQYEAFEKQRIKELGLPDQEIPMNYGIITKL